MMNRYFFFALLIVFCFTAKAEPVDVTEARKVAERLMNKDVEMVDLSASVRSRTTVCPYDTPPFYVFASADGAGFALVSGDDAFPEVIGYSDSGRFAADELPEGLMAYLEMYSQYVTDVRNGIAEAPVVGEAATRATAVVGPLCTTQWGQNAPFYNKCPLVGVRRCVVGCVATALAQIMYYHQHPARPKGTVSYHTGNSEIGRNGILTVNLNTAEHIYEWDMMVNTADECFSKPAAVNALAQLSYDCGVASRMQYDTSGSGTTDDMAVLALRSHFGYSKASTLNLYRSFYGSQEEWFSIIKAELDAKRPVYYSGVSSTGGGADAAGHAFVIDGYDTSGYVHVNWGWDGLCDGYYDIVKLNPDDYTYSIAQSAIIGIKPSEEGEVAQQSRMLAIESGSLAVDVSSKGVDEYFALSLPKFYNYDASTRSWYVGAGLYDKHGNFIQNVASEPELETLQSFYGYSKYDLRCKVPAQLANGQNIVDGDYVLRMIINEDGFNNAAGGKDWILPFCYGGDRNNWLPVKVENNTLYFGQVSTGIETVNPEAEEVISTEYFDIDGRVTNTPRKGNVVVERQTLRNGKVRVVKRMY